MTTEFSCWRCATKLKQVILPMSRREECHQCSTDQHVCKMCQFFIKGRCDEERAEHISDTERANFCDYFKPSTKSQENSHLDKSAAAKAELAALFGDEVPQAEPDNQDLTAAELAEKKLKEMLNNSF
ncbi:hypothetical protein [Paraglaciecola aestuariivivens]